MQAKAVLRVRAAHFFKVQMTRNSQKSRNNQIADCRLLICFHACSSLITCTVCEVDVSSSQILYVLYRLFPLFISASCNIPALTSHKMMDTYSKKCHCFLEKVTTNEGNVSLKSIQTYLNNEMCFGELILIGNSFKWYWCFARFSKFVSLQPLKILVI